MKTLCPLDCRQSPETCLQTAVWPLHRRFTPSAPRSAGLTETVPQCLLKDLYLLKNRGNILPPWLMHMTYPNMTNASFFNKNCGHGAVTRDIVQEPLDNFCLPLGCETPWGWIAYAQCLMSVTVSDGCTVEVQRSFEKNTETRDSDQTLCIQMSGWGTWALPSSPGPVRFAKQYSG